MNSVESAHPCRMANLKQAFVLAFSVILFTACGGGSGGDGLSDSVPPPNDSGQPHTPTSPSTNRAPQGESLTGLNFIQFHPVHLDMTSTFSDPDGDPLIFDIVFHIAGDAPQGMSVEQGVLVGAPEISAFYQGSIKATDPEGLSASIPFSFFVSPNNAPRIVIENEDHLTSIGSPVDIEASMDGAAFMDADGDDLSYEVSLRGEPQELFIDETRVHGVFDSVGAVEVTITASDAYGGSASDVFIIAAPGPEAGEPVLPAISYNYEDKNLELPYRFQNTSYDRTPDDNRTTDAGATLGRVLFYDKRLSVTNTVACASCHQQELGFTIPERFATGVLGVPMRRNPLALSNVRFTGQGAWFWDMRASSLEELVLTPIQTAEEMGSTLQWVESKLAATEFYPPLFDAAFGSPQITSKRIGKAIAQFLQALLSYQSKFNQVYTPMHNGFPIDTSLLTAQELRGAEIFSGVGRCSSCHDPFMLVNFWQANNGLDLILTDPGSQNGIFNRGDMGVFRAPSLNNIAVSGPYMHDGRFATLREVIDHYDHGVQGSPGLDMILTDMERVPQRLNLSDEDKEALEAFLNTFTDTEFLHNPKFSDPFETGSQ